MSQDIFIVDSHCHLNYEGLAHRVPEVIKAANDAGVKCMQTICTRLNEFEDIYKIATDYACVWASVGVHPHDADGDYSPEKRESKHIVSSDIIVEKELSQEEIFKKLIEYAARPKTIGIGETGLDYYYEHSDRKSQQESFITHLEAASKSGLPVIIHTRDAEEDTYNILRNFITGKIDINTVIASEQSERSNPDWIASSGQNPPRNDEIKKPLKGLLHCFTGTADIAKKCMDLGFYISISGIVTFKNATELRDVVKNVIPMDRLLVETDSPFLAPIPYRGKTCEPAYTRNTAEFIAELKGISLKELADKTTENFFKLFDKAVFPRL